MVRCWGSHINTHMTINFLCGNTSMSYTYIGKYCINIQIAVGQYLD